MNKNQNQPKTQNSGSKSQKGNSFSRMNKGKQNTVEGDINSIVKKLEKEKKLAEIELFYHIKSKCWLAKIQEVSIHQRKEKVKMNNNNLCQLGKDQQEIIKRKELRREFLCYINKLRQIRQPLSTKRNFYQQYLCLTEQTSDYLEHCLAICEEQDPRRAVALLQAKGKGTILLILKQHYKYFGTNPSDVTNRILMALQLNPLNDFQFVTWEKFTQMRKLLSGDFNRSEYIDFVVRYFFSNVKQSLAMAQFWLTFTSVVRKLKDAVDSSILEALILKIKEHLSDSFPEKQLLTLEKFRKVLIEQSTVIWHQFTTLIFL